MPVSIDGERLGLVELLERAAEIGCRHGVGIVDHIEDRIVGLKVRDIYEVPAAAILLTAHEELERLVGTIHQNQFKPALDQKWGYLVYAGLWWEPLRTDLDAYMDAVNAQVTGEIGLRLYKGSVRVVTRSSPNAVYDAELATFAESGGLFSQTASPGFIELWSLQSRMAHRICANAGEGERLMYDRLGKAAIRFAFRYLRAPLPARDPHRRRRRGRGRGRRSPPTWPAATSPRAERRRPASRKFSCGLSATCEDSLTKLASLGRLRAGSSSEGRSSAIGAAASLCALLARAGRRRRRRRGRRRIARSEAGAARASEAGALAGRAAGDARRELAGAEAEAAAAAGARGTAHRRCSPKARERAAELAPAGRRARSAGWRSRRRGCGAPARRSPTGWSRSTRAARPSTAERRPRLRRLPRNWSPAPTTCGAIDESDSALADRVAEVRDAVQRQVRAGRRR